MAPAKEDEIDVQDLALDWLTQLRVEARPAGTGPASMHVLWGDRPEGQSDDTSFSKTDSAGPGPKPQRGGRGRGGGGNGSERSKTSSVCDSSETPHLLVESELSSQSLAVSADGTAASSMERPGSHHVVFADDSISEPSETSAAIGGAPSLPPSVGSAMHGVEKCRPCMFINTVVGCANGAACEYCHISHRRRRATRPCKAKRDRFKAIADRQAREAGLLGEAADADGGVGGAGEQAQGGDIPEGAHEDWAEEIDDQDMPIRRNAQGRRILQL
eukprot:CAMPEP_0170325432 /NCGR_PEP_ID=MMETSP0116_2-20130129/63581_1 /TAXON_ID=400756 /ORGANISM="Durinskia baltica, Strain CSIRO CS-38" /LENGTH=272 /DNA_ID=CAMNT_0010578465 /DNA_START=43 /DNA_END=861 /DNA_ORIENTATION=+